MPAPPTELLNIDVDGAIRRRRRRRIAQRSKVPFHEREHVAGQKKHTLWADNQELHGWSQPDTRGSDADESGVSNGAGKVQP